LPSPAPPACVPPYRLRLATLEDVPAIEALIARSIRGLGPPDYTGAQIEGALQGAFGVDSSLIRDGTYFLACSGDGAIAGCGGWSRRRTVFGGDRRAERDERLLDPTVDAAKIRAFFVDPAHARHGIGRLLLERCESAAIAAGFRRFELMATLPGIRLYERFGYRGGPTLDHPLPGGLTIRFLPMSKSAP
jgi:GNAT superfamily N-acetyltransferase